LNDFARSVRLRERVPSLEAVHISAICPIRHPERVDGPAYGGASSAKGERCNTKL
jgi:hypothetical protein